MANTPEDNRYAKSHEYIHVEGDGGTIGITHYAQKELGDVVFVELPQVGTQLEMGDELGSIESVKAVSELFSPVSGEVTEVNEALADKPELVNTDPYGDGWMIKIRLSSPDEVDELMTAEDYDDYVLAESGK
ncbi:MAG TPA: glycine cleavage system protein GcvH [Thermoanaerobaculia bacterium]|jgi:glycine cleavage system H protein|nr:glycine cleavage system protein GcvH [Thermoanaerobaculia bacterium]